MKKLSLLFAMIALVCGNAFAQLSYDFNDGTAGAKIAQTYGEPWTTWGEAPGGNEDGVFAEVGGSMAAYFTYGNDQVIRLGNVTSGAYTLSFDMYIPNGKDAYNNILHIFNGSGSEWATEVHYNTSDHGTAIQVGGTYYNFTCPFDTWFNVKYFIDLDNDAATFYVNSEEVVSWPFSQKADGGQGTRQLGAMDFFPPTSAAKSQYYIDNLEVLPASEEQVLIFDPFEEYNVGNNIALEAIAAGHDWWTTWSSDPGSSEDGVVAEFDGTKCGHLTYGNDQVLLLGDEENGVYDLEFDILVPNGKNGYFNILHDFAGSNSVWALECYLHMAVSGSSSVHSPGSSFLNVAGNKIDGPAVIYDEWMHFRLHVDTDSDVAEYYYTAPGADEILVYTWQWSLNTSGTTYGRKLAAMDFFPPQSAANSEYYLDNFSYTKIGGESAPALSVSPAEVNEGFEVNEMMNVTVTLANDGNSIGDWSGWVEFEQGASGTQASDLMYYQGEYNSGIGSSGAVSRELAIRLTPTMYAGAAMGMKLVSAQYYIGTYTFRVYSQGLNAQPGELLAEKSIYPTASSEWITVSFDEPVYLTGQEIWLSVALEQNAGEYPLSMDGGVNDPLFDGNWLATNGGSFSHCYSEDADGFKGAWMLSAHCQGTLVPGTWATLSKYSGSVMGGQAEELILALNSIGLTGGQIYNATLIFNTNDVNLPHFEIPVTLNVSGLAVAENVNDKIALYPNPANTMVTVEGENLSSVAIYNVAGQLVRIVKLDNTVNNIDMNVEAGVYFFSIYDNDGNNTVQRVVITK